MRDEIIDLFRADGEPGPAAPPDPLRQDPIGVVLTIVRLPFDLLVGVGYLVRELPALLQDLRSLVNDLARLAHEDSALRDVLQSASRNLDDRQRSE